MLPPSDESRSDIGGSLRKTTILLGSARAWAYIKASIPVTQITASGGFRGQHRLTHPWSHRWWAGPRGPGRAAFRSQRDAVSLEYWSGIGVGWPKGRTTMSKIESALWLALTAMLLMAAASPM